MSKIDSAVLDEAGSVTDKLVDLHTQLAATDPERQSLAYYGLLEFASLGSSEAMYLVARCLMTGRGVEPNLHAGHKWLEHAVAAAVPSRAACYALGQLHLHFKIEYSNPEYGIGLLAKALELAHSEALPELLRLCDSSIYELKARKATYRALGTLAAAPDADKAAIDEFQLFCRAFKSSELLDS